MNLRHNFALHWVAERPQDLNMTKQKCLGLFGTWGRCFSIFLRLNCGLSNRHERQRLSLLAKWPDPTQHSRAGHKLHAKCGLVLRNATMRCGPCRASAPLRALGVVSQWPLRPSALSRANVRYGTSPTIRLGFGVRACAGTFAPTIGQKWSRGARVGPLTWGRRRTEC